MHFLCPIDSTAVLGCIDLSVIGKEQQSCSVTCHIQANQNRQYGTAKIETKVAWKILE